MKKLTIKQWLLLLPLFILWIFVLILQGEARQRYQRGLAKGMHCTKVINDVFHITYTYQIDKKPVREYMTWKEFWKSFGY